MNFPRITGPWCPEHWDEAPEQVRNYYIEQDAIAKADQARREAARNAQSPPGPTPGPRAKAPPQGPPPRREGPPPQQEEEDPSLGKEQGKG